MRIGGVEIHALCPRRNALAALPAQSVDVVLTIADGPEMKVRCVIKPDEAQTVLLERLGIVLPKRLAIPKAIAPPTKVSSMTIRLSIFRSAHASFSLTSRGI